MFIVHELIRSLIVLADITFQVLYWMLVVRIVLSWFGVHPAITLNELLSALFQVTDAILAPFRKLPLQIGMLDLTPIVAFIALQFLRRVVIMGLERLLFIF